MKVTISLLNYNKKKYLKKCLESILNQSHKDLEIFLIDNASTDDSQTIFKEIINNSKIRDTLGPLASISAINNQKNIGYSGGHNLAIQKSTGDFILCLNPDIYLDKDYIKNTLKLFRINPKIGAITGKLYKWKFKQDRKTDIIDSCGHQILKSHRIIEWGSNQIDSSKFRTQKVFSISGAAPIYRKSALEKIEYNNQFFDKTFFAYKEDIDLSWRLLHAGYENWLDAKAKAWHDRWQTGTGDSSKKTRNQRKKKSALINQLSYRNHFILNWKNEYLSNMFIYSPWIILYELKKFFYLLFLETRTLKGLFQALKQCPLTSRKRNAILKNSKITAKDIRKYIQ